MVTEKSVLLISFSIGVFLIVVATYLCLTMPPFYVSGTVVDKFMTDGGAFYVVLKITPDWFIKVDVNATEFYTTEIGDVMTIINIRAVGNIVATVLASLAAVLFFAIAYDYKL